MGKVKNQEAADNAKKARQMPETEKILRQFLSLESGNYGRPAYRAGIDRVRSEKRKLPYPMKCREDGYLADTEEDLEWHDQQCQHGRELFELYVEPQPTTQMKIYCPNCGGRHKDRHSEQDHTEHCCEFCLYTFNTKPGVGV